MTLDTVRHAKVLLESHASLSARDAIHASVMKANDIHEVLSFDAGFDSIPGLNRLIS